MTEWLEYEGHIDAIYTDLELSFDKVRHYLLLPNLKRYNSNKQVVDWISSFLSDRLQQVRISDHFSDWVKVSNPMSWILGPLLFMLMIYKS